ncbi:hypothetical protein GCM10010912_36290 [Paenibacillus albidus]|uniref:Uncharacterized protein n=1 Tax=Paenibacillus albidus TaxID=2041023 RepID=A0A917CGH1_9BACL|nr:hypothetical protein [Paenibacillus albidus]GGF87781.1 hypothetical protein GCM10010912_36290 [Paenibacillus albidus]
MERDLSHEGAYENKFDAAKVLLTTSCTHDGKGAENLIIPAGGLKEPISNLNKEETEDTFGNVRSRCDLYMNGPEIFNFTLKEIPEAIQRVTC